METLNFIKTTYNQEYFDYQRIMGEFGGWANKDIFQRYIAQSDKVIDFGCGGGYLLKELSCSDKIGIEVNEVAREIALTYGIKVLPNTTTIPDNWADVIISNHVLEHTLNPLEELIALKQKLRSGGKIIFVVPSEGVYHSYKPNDPNHHLFTWSPMCLGNLFSSAGFTVIEAKGLIYNWPPFYRLLAKLGRPLFNFFCSIYGFIKSPDFSQSRVIAIKP